MAKTTKYLRCHTEMDRSNLTVGKRYEIRKEYVDYEGDLCYEIETDTGRLMDVTVHPDADGKSYATWFTLGTDDNIAESAPITLIPDESLGGTLREYREVKREAAVGDYVSFNEESLGITSGKPYAVLGRDQSGAEFRDDDGDMRWDSHITDIGAKCPRTVLEPTDVLVINGERFRMVDRKAAVGERVIIIDDSFGTGGFGGEFFRVGNVGVCDEAEYVDFSGSGNSYVYRDGRWSVNPSARRVLEPVESVALTAEPALLSDQATRVLSDLPAESQAAANIAALTLKVAALEKRILALETETAPAYVEVASGTISDELPSFMKRRDDAVKPPQQIRDEIVERAKADVVNLAGGRAWLSDGDPLYLVNTPQGSRGTYANFVINREKRTVVALMTGKGTGKVYARGIAKAAPGETFNSALGKAIALHRALGLEVPAEYLNTPQPTEVRVGDVVKGGVVYAVRPTHRTVGVSTPQTFLAADYGYTYIDAKGREEWEHLEYARIIDDSREDSGVTAASSPSVKALSPRKEVA